MITYHRVYVYDSPLHPDRPRNPPMDVFYAKGVDGQFDILDQPPNVMRWYSITSISKEEYNLMAAITGQHAAPTKNAAVPNPRIEVWRGSYVGHWYWHERGVNGKITVTGGEAFSRKWSAKRAAKRYAKAAGLPVVVLDQKNGERP